MMSLHYTNNFYNFRRNCVLRFFVEAPATDNCYLAEENTMVLSTMNWRDQGNLRQYGVTELDRLLLELHSTDPRRKAGPSATGLSGVQLFARIEMPATHYVTLQSLLDDLVAKFNKTFAQRYRLELRYHRDEDDGTFCFYLAHGKGLAIYDETNYFGTVLGLTTTSVVLAKRTTTEGTENNISMCRFSVDGTKSPRLSGTQALYVYTDIIDDQYVGDTLAPLLGYVDVEGIPGSRVGHTCNPLMYLPVNKAYIDTIQIRICDEYGKDVKFPDDVENVVVRLHFRRAKHSGIFSL
jgi:hypothetical protein